MTSAQRPAPKFPLPLERIAGAGLKPAASGSSRQSVLRPQALVQQAAADAARRVVPSGLGLDSVEVRRRMVQRLQAQGLRDAAVIAALLAVPRDRFVDSALVNQAYEDTSLPIGHGQTISKPSIVARMLELLMQGAAARQSGSLGRVLEVGTGCGYQVAVLAQLARDVISIERVRALHDKARAHLLALREMRVRLVYGDGRIGHAPGAPYQSIIAAAGGDAVPQAWLDQLAPGGRLVAPVAMHGGRQQLVVVDRDEQGWQRSVHDAVHFVPLKVGLD